MLRDRQQFEDVDCAAEKLGISSASWPIFGVVWESGEILARIVGTKPLGARRVLEVGCGIGLASLLLSQRNVDITATDHHPEAGAFLLHNTALNGFAPIPFFRTAWDGNDTALGRFDVIIGSDLLYEDTSVVMLSDFIERHASEHCQVIIVDPGRGRQGRFTRRMVEMGYRHDSSLPVSADISTTFRGQVLTYTRVLGPIT